MSTARAAAAPSLDEITAPPAAAPSLASDDSRGISGMRLSILPAVDSDADVRLQVDAGSCLEVVGPVQTLTLLESELGAGSSCALHLSPPAKVTLGGLVELQVVGVPLAATTFSFVYPLVTTPAQYESLLHLAHERPWLFLLLIGGFAYFDDVGVVLQVNALTLLPSPLELALEGPFGVDEEVCAAIGMAVRLHPVTLPTLREFGFESFCWHHPLQLRHALELSSEPFVHGAFVYRTADGESIGGPTRRHWRALRELVRLYSRSPRSHPHPSRARSVSSDLAGSAPFFYRVAIGEQSSKPQLKSKPTPILLESDHRLVMSDRLSDRRQGFTRPVASS